MIGRLHESLMSRVESKKKNGSDIGGGAYMAAVLVPVLDAVCIWALGGSMCAHSGSASVGTLRRPELGTGVPRS